jgi:rfaE bifunctional protein kinase chain/domain
MLNREQVEQLFESFAQKNILIVGDVMIDAYLWGAVDRVSPEAPVPVVSCNKRENRMGGAANVALNVQSLGGNPILCSVIGEDDKASIFHELLQYRGMTGQGIISDPTRPTTTKTRIISNSQQLLRVDQEVTNELVQDIEQQFIENVNNILNRFDIHAIIFQDYDKGCLTKKVIEAVAEQANKLSIPTLVDPKKRHFLDYKNVTLFKPNFKELVEGLNSPLKKGDFDQLEELAQQFIADQGFQYLLTTLSELGVFIANKEKHIRIPAEIRDISDVSGAGDTVVSMAGLCLAAGLDMENLAWLSNLAGGLVCEKVGVVPVQKAWILEDIE